MTSFNPEGKRDREYLTDGIQDLVDEELLDALQVSTTSFFCVPSICLTRGVRTGLFLTSNLTLHPAE